MYDNGRSSLEAAAEAAARVNAMLIAKGKLKPSQVSQNQSNKKSSSSNLVIAEVDINDVPMGCRNMLTKGSTQEEISKMSGSAVSTRGRYMSAEERMRNQGERALYLCVQGPHQEAVDLAVKRINEIIQSGMKQRGTRFSPAIRPPLQTVQPIRPGVPHMNQPPPLIGPPPGAPVAVVEEKLFIGLEHAPPSFDVKGKIVGVGGSYLQHIVSETGAKVTCRGRGSGFPDPITGRETVEPMHVHLQHTTIIGLQQAKSLAENLIQTVQQEYASFQQALAAMPPPINHGPAATAAFITGMQNTSLPGNTLFPHQQGIATIATHVPQQQLQVQPPGVQQIAAPPVMMTPQMISVSTPTSVVLSGASLNTSLANIGPSTIFTPAPGLSVSSGNPALVLPTTLGTSIVSATGTLVAGPQPPTTVGAQMDAVAAVAAANAGLVPNTSLPPPMLQAQAVASPNTFDVPLSETQFIGAPTVNGGQPTHMILSQPPQSVAQVAVQMAAQQLANPLSGPPPPPVGAALGPSGAPGLAQPGVPLQSAGTPLAAGVHPGVQIMTHTGLPPPGLPPLGQPQHIVSQYFPASGAQAFNLGTSSSTASSGSATYTVSSSGYTYGMKEEPPKRRFTEEKQEEKIPENLLGYQHGPPHLTNLMTSGPPPPSMSVSMVSAVPPSQTVSAIAAQEDARQAQVFTSQAGNGMVVVSGPPTSGQENKGELEKQLMPPPKTKGVKRSHSSKGQCDNDKKPKLNIGYEDDEPEPGSTSRPSHPDGQHELSYHEDYREQAEHREFYNIHYSGGKPHSYRPGSPQQPPGPPPPQPHFEQISAQQLQPVYEQYSTQNPPPDQFVPGTQLAGPPQYEQFTAPPPQQFQPQHLTPFSVASSQSLSPFPPHQSPASPQPPFSQAAMRPPETQIIMSQPPPPVQQNQNVQPQFQNNQAFAAIQQNSFNQPLPPNLPPPLSQSQFPPPPGLGYWMGPT